VCLGICEWWAWDGCNSWTHFSGAQGELLVPAAVLAGATEDAEWAAKARTEYAERTHMLLIALIERIALGRREVNISILGPASLVCQGLRPCVCLYLYV
jgi:hypothetical protein